MSDELEALCDRYAKRWRGEGQKIIALAREALDKRKQPPCKHCHCHNRAMKMLGDQTKGVTIAAKPWF